MKKKNIAIVVCAVVVIAAIAASLIFIFGGKDKDLLSSDEQKSVNLKGTWVVVANYTNDAPVFVDEQFMVFTDEQASMYKDASGEAYASSVYNITEAGQLALSDISREYKIEQKTENCVRLYENANTYMLLVRNSSDETKKEVLTADGLNGKWNVTLKAEDLNNGEAMSFEGNTLSYFKDASGQPAATAEFKVENNVVCVPSLNMNMRAIKVSENTVIFVEETGIVWELSK